MRLVTASSPSCSPDALLLSASRSSSYEYHIRDSICFIIIIIIIVIMFIIIISSSRSSRDSSSSSSSSRSTGRSSKVIRNIISVSSISSISNTTSIIITVTIAPRWRACRRRRGPAPRRRCGRCPPGPSRPRKIVYTSRCMRVILAQGPCESLLYRSNCNG